MDDDDIAFDPDKDKIDLNAPLGGGLNSVFVNKSGQCLAETINSLARQLQETPPIDNNNDDDGGDDGDDDDNDGDDNEFIRDWKRTLFFIDCDVQEINKDLHLAANTVERIEERLGVIEERNIAFNINTGKIIILLQQILDHLKEGKNNE